MAMSTPPTGLRVTEAAAADIPAISQFFWVMWSDAGPDAPGFAGATESVIAEIAEPQAIQERIGGPERRMFLAYRDGGVVGFAATRTIDETTVELAGIVVLQSIVGRGVGTPLLAAAVGSARSHGSDQMTVCTEIDNQRAIDFYLRRGFTLTGESTTKVEGAEVAVAHLHLDL